MESSPAQLIGRDQTLVQGTESLVTLVQRTESLVCNRNSDYECQEVIIEKPLVIKKNPLTIHEDIYACRLAVIGA